jgi:hypothetical protein
MRSSIACFAINSSVLHTCQEEMKTGTHSVTQYTQYAPPSLQGSQACNASFHALFYLLIPILSTEFKNHIPLGTHLRILALPSQKPKPC